MPVKKKVSKSKKKATKDEIEDRLFEIIRMILDGNPNVEIVSYVTKKYLVEDRQVYRYLEVASKRLAQVNATNIYASYVRSLSLKYELLNRAMKREDDDLALRILLAIDKQTGVEANSLLITARLDFTSLFFENILKEFDIANESSSDITERRHRFVLAMEKRSEEIFEQAHPFAYQQKQLESGEQSEPDEPEKIVDCFL